MAEEAETQETTAEQTTEAETSTETTAQETQQTTETQTETGTQEAASDWRSTLTKDEKKLGFLGRFASAESFVESFKKLNDDVKAGRYGVKPLGDDATDEEVAAYRKAFGVPEAPDKYLEALPDGLVVGDDDKPAIEQFVKAAHEVNAPKPIVDKLLSTYYDIVDAQNEELIQRNEQAKEDGINALREEWGPEYRRNINVVNSFVETLPEAVQTIISEGTLPDGTLIGNNPEVLRWLASQALEANPLATVVPGAGANAAQTIADEMAEIENVMRTDRTKYNRDEKMQARYRQLIDAKAKAR
ncbi:hypothetical protein BSL82_09545 [Tardibacter chloracetimidivorans]|uniref:Uncharacterized protein n=1 Tax=Tardibacter chloracetimidivorans TaxID=1921510 RepID=A0A1L3ZV43_9SPHN|nr:hypothetical protein [Tardibacter chloracetimidivorans]API59524.1 hypothetical protein BSL82_09545 [Tardibacter chloracetimidivorans]